MLGVKRFLEPPSWLLARILLFLPALIGASISPSSTQKPATTITHFLALPSIPLLEPLTMTQGGFINSHLTAISMSMSPSPTTSVYTPLYDEQTPASTLVPQITEGYMVAVFNNHQYTHALSLWGALGNRTTFASCTRTSASDIAWTCASQTADFWGQPPSAGSSTTTVFQPNHIYEVAVMGTILQPLPQATSAKVTVEVPTLKATATSTPT